jgi:hypothetical protein
MIKIKMDNDDRMKNNALKIFSRMFLHCFRQIL